MRRVGSDRFTIVASVLFDGSGRPPVENAAVTIEGQRIVAVEADSRRVSRWGDTIHDFSGATIAPGLIDPHCHLALQPELAADAAITFVRDATEQEIVAVMQRNSQRALASGVTTLRDCGSPGATGISMRAVAERSLGTHPRVLVSGRPITTTLGHCHWMGLIADSGSELRAAVTALAGEGVDFVKVMATGGMMTSTSNPYAAQYTPEQLTELVLEAKRHSKRVAAHALSAAGVRAAVAARVDTLEHCVTTTALRQDYDPTLNAAVAQAGIIVGVTAHRPLRELLRTGDTAAIRTRLAPHRDLRAAGVRLTVHSDAGTPGSYFHGLAESVEIFQIGLETTIAEALEAATSTAAAAVGLEQQTGLLAPGRSADVVVLDGDLRDDIRALRRVIGVCRSGVFTERDRIRSEAT